MPNFLFVPIGTKTGLTSISLGLLRALQRSGRRPVYYKPVSHKPTPAGGTEAAIVFANKLFHLNPPRPQPLSKVEELVGAGRDDDLIELMVSDFDQVTAAEHDVAIIEGVVPDSERGFLSNKNAQIAAALNANVILVAAAGNHSAEQVADQINLAAQEYANSHTDVAGFIINRYHGNDSKAFAAEVAAKVRSGIPCMGVLPFAPEQSLRRVADIAGYLNAQVIAGQEHLGNRTKEIVVAAQNAAHMHHRITSGALVITPGDREDILMAASLKILSGVPVAVCRFGVVLGRDGGILPQLLKPVRYCAGRLGSGEQPLPWVHLDDAVAAIRFLATQTHNGFQAYNITAPKRTTQLDFARAAAQRLRRPLLFSVPEQMLRLMLGEQADLVLDGQFAPPKALLQQGFEFAFPTIESALDNLLG